MSAATAKASSTLRARRPFGMASPARASQALPWYSASTPEGGSDAGSGSGAATPARRPRGALQRFAVGRDLRERAQRAVGRAEQRHAAFADGVDEEGLDRPVVADHHQHGRLGRPRERRQQVLRLVALRHRRPRRNAEHDVADVLVGGQRVDDVAHDAGVAHADRRVVERVLRHGIGGQHLGEALRRRLGQRGQLQADRIGEVERDVLHRARAGHEGRALGRRHRKARAGSPWCRRARRACRRPRPLRAAAARWPWHGLRPAHRCATAPPRAPARSCRASAARSACRPRAPGEPAAGTAAGGEPAPHTSRSRGWTCRR